MEQMSSPVTLGPVAHFSLAVSDPPNRARWWTTNFTLEEWSSSDDKVVLGNHSVVFTMVRGRPDPMVLTHLAFRVSAKTAVAFARDRLRNNSVDIADSGAAIGANAPGSATMWPCL